MQVLEQFLQHPVETHDQLMHAYLVGARLETFLKDVLPQHPEFSVRTRTQFSNQQLLATVTRYLEQISFLIDQQAYQDFVQSVLVDSAGAAAAAAANGYADPSLDMGTLDESTASSSSIDVVTGLRKSTNTRSIITSSGATSTFTTTEVGNAKRRASSAPKQQQQQQQQQQSHPPLNKNSSIMAATSSTTNPPLEEGKEVWHTTAHCSSSTPSLLPAQKKAHSTAIATLVLPSATVSPGTSYETATGSTPSDEEKKEDESTPRVTNKAPWVQEWCKNNSNNNKPLAGNRTTSETQPWNPEAETSKKYVSPDELVRRNKNSVAGSVDKGNNLMSPGDMGYNYVSPEEKMRRDLFYEEPASPRDERAPATTRKPKRSELSYSPPIWENVDEEKEETPYQPLKTSLSQKLDHQRRAPTSPDEDSGSDLFSGLTSTESGVISVTSSMFQDAAIGTNRRSKSPPKNRKSMTKMQVVPEEEQQRDDSFRMNIFEAFSSTPANSGKANCDDPFSSNTSFEQRDCSRRSELGRKDPPGRTPSARRRERQQKRQARSLHPLAPPSNDSRHTTKETSRCVPDPLDDLVKRKAAEKDDFFAQVAKEKSAWDAWDSEKNMPWDDGYNKMNEISLGQPFVSIQSSRRVVAEDEESMVMETRRLSLQPFRNCVRSLLD